MILCVDVGLANIGAVVVDPKAMGCYTAAGSKAHLIAEFAYFHTEKSDRKARWRYSDDRARRVQEVARFYRDIVKRHGIKRAAAELPIGGAPNSQAATDLALASTAFIAVMEVLEVAVEFYDPREVKKAATGRENGTKDQVMDAVSTLYPEIMDQFPTKEKREHVSDAVGVYLAARHGNLFRL